MIITDLNFMVMMKCVKGASLDLVVNKRADGLLDAFVEAGLDLVEISLGYPEVPDIGVVALVLAKYTLIGAVPMVIPSPAAALPPPC